MQYSQQGLIDTESFEGCRLTAYQDSGGVWTIGYGHTANVIPHSTITQPQAESLLRLDVQYAVGVVNAHALPCTQGQFDALVDFVFNLGATALLQSSLLKYHLAGEYDKAAAEFPKWDHCNGHVLQGLLKRRESERDLYTSQEQ